MTSPFIAMKISYQNSSAKFVPTSTILSAESHYFNSGDDRVATFHVRFLLCD